eukprot:CAMPEP_0204486800 /NCGR_PEP_ID=MMETSP0471-20130131/65144_1 /ASSEMBLY_ACC=CAM_ASM_000602 /TAXON_ID=2969 /ORGANISM="Oxyrrhis marina" /LENGTH=77 /DNA_ID=CAMNT_0051490433 /DNA_START=184 /DNA_END=420 /DNA_ORIENTATION=-
MNQEHCDVRDILQHGRQNLCGKFPIFLGLVRKTLEEGLHEVVCCSVNNIRAQSVTVLHKDTLNLQKRLLPDQKLSFG